jgi:hypothetical protein
MVFLIAGALGFVGSHSDLWRGGVHRGPGLGFVALATVLGAVAVVLGVCLSANVSSRAAGLVIVAAGSGFLFGAWMAVLMLLAQFV